MTPKRKLYFCTSVLLFKIVLQGRLKVHQALPASPHATTPPQVLPEIALDILSPRELKVVLSGEGIGDEQLALLQSVATVHNWVVRLC